MKRTASFSFSLPLFLLSLFTRERERAKNDNFESQSFVSFISIVSLELLISIPLLPLLSSWVTGCLLRSLVQWKKGVMFLRRVQTENPESHSLCSSVIQSSSRSTRHRCLFSRDTRYFFVSVSFASVFSFIAFVSCSSFTLLNHLCSSYTLFRYI